jgi:hypothetical protein
MFTSLNLLGPAEAKRDLARRARRLAGTMTASGDRARLLRYAEELERQADRLGRRSNPAVIAPSPASD